MIISYPLSWKTVNGSTQTLSFLPLGSISPTVSIIGLGLAWKPCRRPQGTVACSEGWNWPAEWDRMGMLGSATQQLCLIPFIHAVDNCCLPLKLLRMCSESPRHLEKQCPCHTKHLHFFIYSQWPMIPQVGRVQSPWPGDSELPFSRDEPGLEGTLQKSTESVSPPWDDNSSQRRLRSAWAISFPEVDSTNCDLFAAWRYCALFARLQVPLLRVPVPWIVQNLGMEVAWFLH